MSGHLKRLAAPKSWPIKRKFTAYTTRPSPGPHRIAESIPLGIVLRDLLKLTNTARETKIVLQSGKVLVDKVARKDHRFPIGVMDVLSIPDIKKNYLVTYDSKGNFLLKDVPDSETGAKHCQIINKTLLRKGMVQLNLYDGKNIIVGKGVYNVGDSVLVSLESMRVTKHIKLQEGALIYLIGGKHVGKTGALEKIKNFKSIEEDKIVIKTKEETIETLKRYAFAIDKPL